MSVNLVREEKGKKIYVDITKFLPKDVVSKLETEFLEEFEKDLCEYSEGAYETYIENKIDRKREGG